MKAQRTSWGVVLLIHNHSTVWGWVVNTTPRPLYLPGETWLGFRGLSVQVWKTSSSLWFEPWTFQNVASLCIDRTTLNVNKFSFDVSSINMTQDYQATQMALSYKSCDWQWLRAAQFHLTSWQFLSYQEIPFIPQNMKILYHIANGQPLFFNWTR